VLDWRYAPYILGVLLSHAQHVEVALENSRDASAKGKGGERPMAAKKKATKKKGTKKKAAKKK
jgi:hypothetical protein